MDEFETEVIRTLERIETKLDNACADIAEGKISHEALRGKVEAQGRDIARLQVKAGLYGTLAGALTGVLTNLGMK